MDWKTTELMIDPDSEATAGIEPAMKVLQTSRVFFAHARENIRKFEKVALTADHHGCADLCGSSRAQRRCWILSRSRSDDAAASPVSDSASA